MLSLFRNKFLFLFFLSISELIYSQSDTLVFNTESSYRDWNWSALVIGNNYITAAIVPSMGGNMLQYDFGIDTFLLTNPDTYGNVYDPAKGQSPFNGDWGFGGFEVWPTPEQWPPSPTLTFGLYHDTLLFQTADSLQLKLSSQTEINSFPGIRYEKLYTAYKNSTIIKFQNSMINCGSNPVKIGMMNVEEVSSEHIGLNDYNNFKIYFPIRKNSLFGNKCVRISPVSAAFKGEIAPGVFGVEYNRVRGKVFADSPEGWIAFVDERDTQTYVCLYNVFEGAEYPDQGANTEVYIENNVSFMAIEAISPLVTLNPVSDTFRFTEYFASTSINGAILKANMAGVVTEKLTYDSLSGKLSGKFGVFSKSMLQLLYCDSLENILEEGKTFSANPDSALIIDEEVILPAGTQLIKLRAFNISGDITADIDEEDFIEDEYVTTTGIIDQPKIPYNVIRASYSDNGELSISFNRLMSGFIKIELINISGIPEKVLYDTAYLEEEQNLTCYPGTLQKGVYFIRITGIHEQYVCKILL